MAEDFASEGSKKRIREFLREKLLINKGYLKTGFVGTYILNKVLSDYGSNDLAYKLLLNEDYPSRLYAVNMGATTASYTMISQGQILHTAVCRPRRCIRRRNG